MGMMEKKCMVQREVKKKTSIYGIVAVLSAIVLVSTVYVIGSAPIIFPPSQAPNVGGMKTFSSNQQIIEYLSTNSKGNNWYGGGPLDDQFFGRSLISTPIPAPVQATGSFGESNSLALPTEYWTDASYDYSTTNIQVNGVDEADTVKTDGNYIYTTSTTQNQGVYYSTNTQSQSPNTVYVLDANPQNAHVVSKIVLGNNTQPAGLYLSADGNKLVVLASKYWTYHSSSRWAGDVAVPMIMPAYQSDVYTYINVYDVTNKANPVLTRNFTATGSYFNSRMIGNNVYAVVSQTAWVYNDLVSLPTVYEGENTYAASPSNIYYADMNDSSFSFTSFYGLNVIDDYVAPTNMTVMMGGASTMYVSNNNIYVTYPNWNMDTGAYTSIYRVGINGLQLTFQAQGSVPGNTINQYSMDEYSGSFRVATNWYSQESQVNNVYILDSQLNVIGKLEGLAPNENLHAVRFMGDKCYLVTFKKTDPLFVIDLSQPSNPTVLGELKIPGYSDYLHPYDESHLIGIGKEAVEANEGDFAWYQGLKLSLFDVSDVNNPVQLSNVSIGDRGTDSEALTDPHAFLFDKSKNLLVIPVTLAVVSDANKQAGASAYGQTTWQGAYVYSLSLDGGFVLKGTVTHLDREIVDYQGNYRSGLSNVWEGQNYWVTRSLYIGNTLYTVSNGEVKLNNLTDLTPIVAVNLS
jgi:inhibitor of cysteine peptidase